MASFVAPESAGSGLGGLVFLRIRDVSVEDNFIDLCLHEEVRVPTEELSSLICKTLFNVDCNDVDAIGTFLNVEGSAPLVYTISSLSSTPSIFKDMPNIAVTEWVPLFFSETSGRYFYFGDKREICLEQVNSLLLNKRAEARKQKQYLERLTDSNIEMLIPTAIDK